MLEPEPESKPKPVIKRKQIEAEPDVVKSEVKVKVKVKVKAIKAPKTAKAPARGKKLKVKQEFDAPDLKMANTDNLVISFDVGIINLAYCVMELKDSGPVIYDWNIINMAGGDPKKTCSRTLANGKGVCKNKAFYLDNEKGLCLIHSKGLDTPLTRNLTVANVTEAELKERLFRALDANPIFLEPNMVLVEQQPLKGMEKIRGVGHALFDYFVLRGVLDKEKHYSVLKFIDAKNKLTVYDGPPISCHLKTQYARNKWYAEKYCAWAIRDLPQATEFFTNFGQKKDDLADCFMQGLWFLKYGINGTTATLTSNHQKLVYKENNMIKYKTVRPHAPTKKAMTSGKFSLSNIKYFIARKTPVEGLKASMEFYGLDDLML